MSFSIVGTQVSQQLAQSQTCSLSGLIAAATTQAQNLAAASGFTLGAILAMSSSTSNSVFTPDKRCFGAGLCFNYPRQRGSSALRDHSEVQRDAKLGTDV